MEPKWAILGQNANSFILVFLFSIRREGGTMRDLAGWYLGWYRAARAWRLHRGLIPAPKGLCGHKEAINLACNPSGGWNPPHPTFRGPDKSSVHPCLLHAHWPGSTRLKYKWDSLSFYENWARAQPGHVVQFHPILRKFAEMHSVYITVFGMHDYYLDTQDLEKAEAIEWIPSCSRADDLVSGGIY